MKLVMTLLVRDEADILEANLRYHFAQGVDFVVATDNGSTDGSREILERYVEMGLLHLVHEETEDFVHLQGDWITRMARLAATDFRADWVINDDADEFWWPVSGSLKETFASVPDRYHAVIAPRPEFLPRLDGEGTFTERLVVREARSRAQYKLAHRGIADITVYPGSHWARRAGPGGGRRRPGRALLRPASSEFRDDDLLIPAPYWPIRILHFPLRSYDQFQTRVSRMVRHEGSSADRKGARRQLADDYSSGRLPGAYRRLVPNDVAVEIGLREGRLVRDVRLRDFLARCSDPLSAGSERDQASRQPADREPTAEERQADLEQLQEDAMLAITRNEHALLQSRESVRRRMSQERRKARGEARKRERAERKLERVRDRERALRRREKELARRLRVMEASRWWRMRAAAARVVGRGSGLH